MNEQPWFPQYASNLFWIAFGASAVVAYPIWRLLLLTKSRQTISEYAPEGHQVKQGTPTMGGLIVIAGYLVAAGSSYFIPLPEHIGYMDKGRSAFLVLAVGFAMIGFIDDFVVPRLVKGKRGLGWKQKIVMQLGLAILATGLCFEWQLNLSFAASVFLILFFSNAYNFSDGLDGLAGTLLLGLLVGIVGVGLMTAWTEPVLAMVVPLAGAVIPFLFLNAPPAKVFMGDVGSLPIGAILGLAVACLTVAPTWPYIDSVTGMVGTGSAPVVVACLLLSVMMIVELVPVPLQILSVKLRKKRLFPYTPVHHAFEKAGWPESRVVWMFALLQLLLSLAAISVLIPHLPSVSGVP
jgi:phospho-N-acetylmuramoyl-pentapeptide-transferase